MSCHQCAKKLPFRSQQSHCQMCKFIMCKKCLCNTLPSQDSSTYKDKSFKVCLECYEKVTKNIPDTDNREIEPPKLFKKRVEELKNRTAIRPVRPAAGPTCSPILSRPGDTAKLAQRLDALTADERQNLPTEAELQTRLNALSNFISTRQIDSLSKPKTSEDEVKNIIDEAQDAARIATKHGIPLEEEKSPTSERIYCSLCDENVATVICPACMDDEFCNHCFLRAHKSKLLRHHESIPITKANMK
ncbi:unnamed protein product [Hymenolepis diminuta]|uniref:FYVE-type domain-containing protein n=1 Tax=Hymenolepis diminuta TaxID=6216 RepID=A0A0R3SQE9_HYMDI|nr:unnamed protein product [Hymenolepis diminuta]VUZ47230.1 unnamed protein product [Hymenolepis diminuta]